MFAAMFAMAGTALTVLTLLLVLTAFTDAVKLWPTPSPNSWQSYVFWPLFRGGLGLTILLGLWTLIGAPALGWEAAVGALLALTGLGLTIYGYFDLGIDKTYGRHDGLVTSGLYRYSRNPQYVTSILGFSGLAIAAGSPAMALLCALAVAVYILLPFAEEPWLATAYGDGYEAYKRTTPRFIGLPKLAPKPLPSER